MLGEHVTALKLVDEELTCGWKFLCLLWNYEGRICRKKQTKKTTITRVKQQLTSQQGKTKKKTDLPCLMELWMRRFLAPRRSTVCSDRSAKKTIKMTILKETEREQEVKK